MFQVPTTCITSMGKLVNGMLGKYGVNGMLGKLFLTICQIKLYHNQGLSILLIQL